VHKSYNVAKLFHAFQSQGISCDTVSADRSKQQREQAIEAFRKGKVRFLALTDQDNGDNSLPGSGSYYSPTYPRPWFGWWDAATGRLHSWGGYDPSLKQARQSIGSTYFQNKIVVNGRAMSHSAFYYEGFEGEIAGCLNPEDRLVLDDQSTDPVTGLPTGINPNGGGYANSTDFTAPSPSYYTLLRKGEPRPLITARWLDFAVLFNPDGSVVTDWFRLRNAYAYGVGLIKSEINGPSDPVSVAWPPYAQAISGVKITNNPWIGHYPALACTVMDRTSGCMNIWNMADASAQWPNASPAQREATDYVSRTGFYWITLAPDAPDDTDTYPSAQAALRTLAPMYRVGISPEGLVKVIRVASVLPTDRSLNDFDTTIAGADWENKNKIWGKVGITTYDPTKPPTLPAGTRAPPAPARLPAGGAGAPSGSSSRCKT
jgi:hypothetical protein